MAKRGSKKPAKRKAVKKPESTGGLSRYKDKAVHSIPTQPMAPQAPKVAPPAIDDNVRQRANEIAQATVFGRPVLNEHDAAIAELTNKMRRV